MQLKMFLLGLAMPLRDELSASARRRRLRLRYGRLEVPWTVGPRSDFDVLNEVLVLKAYGQVLPQTEPTMILDLGSHIGASVLFSGGNGFLKRGSSRSSQIPSHSVGYVAMSVACPEWSSATSRCARRMGSYGSIPLPSPGSRRCRARGSP